jgi:formamidopyrimidine-DNA glycosylase
LIAAHIVPELPEVETTRRGIAPALAGRRIRRATVRERRLRWPIAAEFESAVRNQIIRKVERRAKYLLIRLGNGTMILHLGMSGSLRLVSAGTAPKIHEHWDLLLDSGRILRFHDPRRFGSLLWTEDDPLEHVLLRKLAPEPLSAAFNADYLFRATRKRSVAIKQFIMNSSVVVGVGNIYASEALFRAGIAPRRAARRLTRPEAAKLSHAIKAVLKAAIEIGGTTLRDYVNAEGAPGYFRQKLFVYERAGMRCRVCRSPIKQFTQGQRSTYWCPVCQT